MSRIGFAALAAVVMVWAGPALAADIPKGTFTRQAPDGSTWAITFDGKDRYTVSRDGKEAAVGRYTVTKDQIVVTDEGGPRAVKGQPGTYTWKLDGKKLTFTRVKDEAGGRAAVVTGGAWELQEKK